MARSLTSVVRDQVISDEVQIALFAKLAFDSGDVRVWTGIGDSSLGGEIYNGVGQFGGISNYKETMDVKATTITLTLSGIPSALISIALSEEFQGRPCKIWMGFFDDAVSPGGLLEDPILVFSGRMDTMSMDIGSETATISVEAANILVNLEHALNLRFNREDNLLTLKTLGNMDNGVPALVDENGDLQVEDKGFDFVPSLQDSVIFWGKLPLAD